MYTFQSCTKLTNIIIPEGVTHISDESFSGSGIVSIALPETLKSIGTGSFSACKYLETITFPNSLTSIGDSAFSGCTKLNNLVIPDNVTNIGQYTFNGCTNLNSVQFSYPIWNVINVNNYSKTQINVSSSSTAATYLKSTYANKRWSRN